MNHESMPMWFTFNMYPYTVLFEEWKITEEGALIASCFGVMGLAIVYEIIKNLRKLWERTVLGNLENKLCRAKDKLERQDYRHQMKKFPKFWMHHAAQSFLHTIQVFLGYSLMLIVMTFNVWLLLSTVVGAGIGYLLGEGMLAGSEYIVTEEIPRHFRDRSKTNHSSSDETSFSSSCNECKQNSF